MPLWLTYMIAMKLLDDVKWIYSVAVVTFRHVSCPRGRAQVKLSAKDLVAEELALRCSWKAADSCCGCYSGHCWGL